MLKLICNCWGTCLMSLVIDLFIKVGILQQMAALCTWGRSMGNRQAWLWTLHSDLRSPKQRGSISTSHIRGHVFANCPALKVSSKQLLVPESIFSYLFFRYIQVWGYTQLWGLRTMRARMHIFYARDNYCTGTTPLTLASIITLSEAL